MCRGICVSLVCAAFLNLGGCAASSPNGTSRLGRVYEAYGRQDYVTAGREARALADGSTSHVRDEAAYMAGLSAIRLGQMSTAERYLRRATRSGDQGLKADALAELGLLYAAAGRYREAAAAFEQAAPRLQGQARASAYFHAGAALQKLGQTSRARANFTLARSHSSDPAFRRRIDDEMATVGFTLQIGFFTSATNAQRAAASLNTTPGGRQLGPPRLVPATDAQGRSGYLVQIGQFSSYASAIGARRSLGSQTMVVPLGR